MVGHESPALTVAIIVENFTSAIGTVIFVAYLSALCRNPLHTATQYALLTALAAVGRTYLSSGAGFIAEATGWVWFFAICALPAIPSLLLLAWLQTPRAFRRGWQPGEERRHQARVDGRTVVRCRIAADKRALIEIIEFAADRHAMRKPRHLHLGIVQQVGDVMRRGLTVDRGVERQDHLFHLGSHARATPAHRW